MYPTGNPASQPHSGDRKTVTDVLIYGGGPTGLFAAYCAGMYGLTVAIVDPLPELGGQLTALYPDKEINDVAGFPAIIAKDLAANLIKQAVSHNTEIILEERITALERLSADSGPLYGVTLKSAGVKYFRAILLTGGFSEMAMRILPLPDAKKFEAKGVLYCVKDRTVLRDARVLIVGGGDSAFDWAYNLVGYARSVTLIHRRDAFRARVDNVNRLLKTTAIILRDSELRTIVGKTRVEGAGIVNMRTAVESMIGVDYILVMIGFESSPGPMADWGLTLSAEGAVFVSTRMETSRPGIYAAGDVAEYPGKVKLIVTGFGEAVTAMNAIRDYLRPVKSSTSS